MFVAGNMIRHKATLKEVSPLELRGKTFPRISFARFAE